MTTTPCPALSLHLASFHPQKPKTLWNCRFTTKLLGCLAASPGSAESPLSRTEKFPLPKPWHCAYVALPSAVGGCGDTAQSHCSEHKHPDLCHPRDS